jgi:DNA-binding response OmpR family regulator
MRPSARALILTANPQTVSQFIHATRQARIDWLSLAETVQDAMHHCVFGGHSLALVDRDLDAADGLDFVHAIRREPDHPSYRMPVIVVSARAGHRDRSAADAAGVVAYFVKPVSVAALSDQITRVFDDVAGRPCP